MNTTWQAPLADGKKVEEQIVRFDEGRARRILILPAWFDEANKLRRQTIELMRSLDQQGVDSFLPDLPGCNDSLAPLEKQTLGSWRMAAQAAGEDVSATHVLAIRAATLIAPRSIAGWHYAPQTGRSLLRNMIRARTLAAREAGRDEGSDALMQIGRSDGIELAGWRIGAEMFRELESAEPLETEQQKILSQKDIGGPGLWLRAEPSEDQDQVQSLAAMLASIEADPA